MSWHDNVDREQVLVRIITAYKLRIDDAYADIGILRGLNKSQMAEYAREPWCQPEADLRRFVDRGLQRGALPSWWSDMDTTELVRCADILGITLCRGCVEPIDLLRIDGTGRLLHSVRMIGDLFEGPPSWGTADRGPRDHVEGRETLRLKRHRGKTIVCPRCRADVTQVAEKGIGHVNLRNAEDRHRDGLDGTTANSIAKSCPHCFFQGACPRCDGDVEGGSCTTCGHQPVLYKVVTSLQPKFARAAAKLAATLPHANLQWCAVGHKPDLCDPERREKMLSEEGVPASVHGKIIRVRANENDHLGESQCPELLRLEEATRMHKAGLQLIQRSLGTKDSSSSVDSITRRLQLKTDDGVCSIKVLKLGAQLIGDAYIADNKCADLDAGSVMLLMLALKLLADTDNRADDFLPSAYAFYFAVYTAESMFVPREPGREHDAGGEARRFLDALIECGPSAECSKWDASKCKFSECSLYVKEHTRLYARLLFSRSADKLIRLADQRGAYKDLDLAIAQAPDGAYNDLRVSMRASQSTSASLEGAKQDIEAWLRCPDTHVDNRYMHEILYVLAAIYSRQAQEQPSGAPVSTQKSAKKQGLQPINMVTYQHGAAIYERAVSAEVRHRYLYGVVREKQKEIHHQELVCDHLTRIAHQAYSTSGQRVERLRSTSPQTALELRQSIDDLVRVPPSQVPGYSSDEDDSSFQVGDAVVVHGLLSVVGQRHNHKVGTIDGELTDDRHAVMLANGAKINVKPANLRRSVARPGAVPIPVSLPAERASQTREGRIHELAGAHAAAQLNALADPVEFDEAKAAIAACTDVEKNSNDPTGDGDQSFVRAVLNTDSGMRLKLARHAGMDFSMCDHHSFELSSTTSCMSLMSRLHGSNLDAAALD